MLEEEEEEKKKVQEGYFEIEVNQNKGRKNGTEQEVTVFVAGKRVKEDNE